MVKVRPGGEWLRLDRGWGMVEVGPGGEWLRLDQVGSG